MGGEREMKEEGEKDRMAKKESGGGSNNILYMFTISNKTDHLL